MKYQCSDCPYIATNIYASQFHAAQEHQKYEDGKTVESKTKERYDKVGLRVLKLLFQYPDTRNPKGRRLYTRYKQYYNGHALVYVPGEKGWATNKRILKENDLADLWGELTTIDRRSRDFRKADKDTYHDYKSPWFNQSHKCILPKPKDQLLALEEERVIRERYSGQQDMNMVI